MSKCDTCKYNEIASDKCLVCAGIRRQLATPPYSDCIPMADACKKPDDKKIRERIYDILKENEAFPVDYINNEVKTNMCWRISVAQQILDLIKEAK